MPNIFAYLVLYGWPLVAFWMYWKLPIHRAFIWSILVGYLFMPPASAAFDLPALPEFTKLEIAAVSSFVMAIAFHGVGFIKIPRSPLLIAIILGYLFVPVFTVLTNAEDVVYGLYTLSGMSFIEIPALVLYRAFFLIPFIMAYSVLSDFEHLTDVLYALVIGLMAYSVLILFEVRVSPQLNTWIYGFFQHSFLQMVRGDGFRSIVFLYHALWVGFFTVMGLVAAIALYKNPESKPSGPFMFAPERIFRRFFRESPVAVYLVLGIVFMVVLVLSKSMGPILFGITLTATLLVIKPRYQLLAAGIVGLIVFSYPILRGVGLVPAEQLVDLIATINPDRAASFEFRLDNELILMDRALEKLLFGWGEGARHLILDPLFGRLVAIPDGQWVIILGAYGIVGFICEMGLILIPVLMALRWSYITDPKIVSPLVPAYALLIAANAVDMIPNATLTHLTFIMAGVLWRHLEGVPERLKTQVSAPSEQLFGGVILPRNPLQSGKRTIL